MRRFVPITLRVNLIIVTSLALGIGAMVAWLAVSQYRSAIDETDRDLSNQSQLFYYAIKNLMLPGEAPIAVSFIADLRNTSLDQELMLWRADGTEAFVDNATLERVNTNIAAAGFPKRFAPRPEPTGTPARLADPDGLFGEAVETGNNALVQSSQGDRVVRTLYAPLSNGPLCAACHGADHSVRGVIQITTDLTDELAAPRRALFLAGGAFLVLVTLLALLLSGFLHRAILLPVKRIGEVCTGVAEGRFDERVASTRSDEIGELGRTVNSMVDGLFERFHLTKYVSASTVASIHDGEATRRVTMTMLFSDVRGFTAFTEANQPEEVVTAAQPHPHGAGADHPPLRGRRRQVRRRRGDGPVPGRRGRPVCLRRRHRHPAGAARAPRRSLRRAVGRGRHQPWRGDRGTDRVRAACRSHRDRRSRQLRRAPVLARETGHDHRIGAGARADPRQGLVTRPRHRQGQGEAGSAARVHGAVCPGGAFMRSA